MSSLRQNEKRALVLRSIEILTRVRTYLWTNYKRKLYTLPPLDCYRLLTLCVWEDRYKVDLDFILDLLLPIYQKKFKQQNKAYGLGTRVATLVGRKSEQILQEAIAEQYSEYENIRVWKHKRQRELRNTRNGDDMLFKAKTLLDFDDPTKYYQYYRRKIERHRDEIDSVLDAKENRIHIYRNSPWV